MNSTPNNPCLVCSSKYPHECGIKVVPHSTCRLCGAPAYLAPDGVYRHANEPFEDQSTFCDKYGYPIPVEQSGVPLQDMADLIEKARALGPMTDEQRREQAASFAFGNLALTKEWCDKPSDELAKLRDACRRAAGCIMPRTPRQEYEAKTRQDALAGRSRPKCDQIWGECACGLTHTPCPDFDR
jgi:hypothetical protein